VEVHTLTSDDDGAGKRDRALTWRTLTADTGATRTFVRKVIDFYKVAPGMVGWLRRHVHEFDVVHIHALFSFSSIVVARAARRAGIPYIIRPLGTLDRYGVTQRRPWLKRLSMAMLEGPALRQAAAVHFTSEGEQEQARSWGIPMRGVVIPLGIEPPAVADSSLGRRLWPALGDGPVVLYLSRLDPKKNVEGLLEAWVRVTGRHPQARLLVAGGGDAAYAAALQAKAGQLGLAGSVVWAGPVEGDAKAAALGVARLFVLPSYSENFGIAAVEALMAGLPCVLAKGVAIASDVQASGAGLCVLPDKEAIAAALDALLTDTGQCRVLSAQARQLARQQYSAEAMGANLRTLYKKVTA
jgi:glycosyltransferase involved in cell wall biosynthesis